jgi:hypothetical protein
MWRCSTKTKQRLPPDWEQLKVDCFQHFAALAHTHGILQRREIGSHKVVKAF